MSKETTVAGWGIGIRRLGEGEGPEGITWCLDVVDCIVGPTGKPVPDTGTGEIIHVLLGDDAAAALYASLREGGAGGVKPVPASALRGH